MGLAEDPLFRCVAAIGDSVSQGCQNVGVSVRSQRFGVPTLIARQAGAVFPLPWIAEPGYPPHIDHLLTVVRARSTDKELLVGRRLNPTVLPHNLAVAGATIADVISLTTDSIPSRGRTVAVNRLTELVLNPLGRPELGGLSQLDRAIALDPSLVFCWVGANDVVETLFYPDHPVTPPGVFRRRLAHLLDRLLHETRAELVVIGLPDLTMLPLFQLWRRRPRLLRRLGAMTAAYNEILASFDRCRGRVLFVDLQPEMARVTREGQRVEASRMPCVPADGRLDFAPLRGYRRRLLSGGLVSYDGLHPTAPGYGLMANVVIRAMRERFAIDLPLLDLEALAWEDEMLLRPNRHTWRFTALYVPAEYVRRAPQAEAAAWPVGYAR